jgi:DNA-directed RNA polymerase specialized sigma24 family protein
MTIKSMNPNGTSQAAAFAETQQAIRDMVDWPDSWLIAAARREPVNVHALDTLIDRYWKPLFAHCRMLTVDPEQGAVLAQEVWRHLLQARPALPPTGDFRAHLTLTAAQLWRGQTRSPHTSAAVATARDFSTEASQSDEDEEEIAFACTEVADLNSLSEEEKVRLEKEIDGALEELTPFDRDVLLSRHLNGEPRASVRSATVNFQRGSLGADSHVASR